MVVFEMVGDDVLVRKLLFDVLAFDMVAEEFMQCYG